MKKALFITLTIAIAAISLSGCASLTNEPMVPIAISFSDGGTGHCELENKRGIWETGVPGTTSVRRSDDGLKYHCETTEGYRAIGQIPSYMGAKIALSAIFWDFGIVDSITDMHRYYPASFVIPIQKDWIQSSDNREPLYKRVDKDLESFFASLTQDDLYERVDQDLETFFATL